MKDFLTAEQAHEYADLWHNTEVQSYVNKALNAIEARAKAGHYTATVHNPFQCHVNLDECKRAMKALGYIVHSELNNHICWKWQKKCLPKWQAFLFVSAARPRLRRAEFQEMVMLGKFLIGKYATLADQRFPEIGI